MTDSDSICTICATTDFALAFDPSRWNVNADGKALGYPEDRAVVHHPSIASLRVSALQGCPTCFFLLGALKLPLKPQQPEAWDTYEAKESKKAKKAAKKEYDDARRREENSGPCLIVAIKVEDIHQDFVRPNGAVAGFRYGPKFGSRIRSPAIGLIASASSPKSIGTRNLLSLTDTGLCREWLKLCQTEHHTCPSVSNRSLPTRLIYVGESTSGANPKLVETRGQTGEYITLSHCWGQSRPPSTTKANLSSHMASMPLQSMPKTFRDAVKLVRLLGYRYLWIDSYCIIQDDEADWQRECASMAAIYSNCVVTLASPYASNCHAGFSRGSTLR